jgi:hypothetical protein
MTRFSLAALLALTLAPMHEQPDPPLGPTKSPPYRAPEQARELTAQDVERIEAARQKRERRAAKRGGKL